MEGGRVWAGVASYTWNMTSRCPDVRTRTRNHTESSKRDWQASMKDASERVATSSTPWNNKNVRLFGLRISIFRNYLGGVRISNFFFRPIYFGGSNFRVRILLLANYFSRVRISNLIYLRKHDCPSCGCCLAGGLDFENFLLLYSMYVFQVLKLLYLAGLEHRECLRTLNFKKML